MRDLTPHKGLSKWAHLHIFRDVQINVIIDVDVPSLSSRLDLFNLIVHLLEKLSLHSLL